ncbi:MAG: TauD/TfdA family dioxygenase [Pseudomonadota bacterium]
MATQLKIRKAAGALGAFVEGADLGDIAGSDDLFSQVQQAVLEHEVVFMRDQQVPAPVFQDFARRFGPVLGHPAYTTVPEADDVQVLASTPDMPSKIELWHSDMTFSATPPTFTILHGQIIPEFGGDTLWSSATAAYDHLSEPMQQFLGQCRAEHDFRHGFRESLAEAGGEERLAEALKKNPPVWHPLIRTHPQTGRKAIYVNPLFTTRIEGLQPIESEHLLSFLYRHMVTEEFTVRLNWQPGTVVIWDNRSTQHKPVNDFLPQSRKLHRVTIKGGRPV